MDSAPLRPLAFTWLSLSAVSAAVIAFEIVRGARRQKMWIMDIVWPLTALYAGPLALWMFFRFFRFGGHNPTERSFPETVALGDTHCGAGCTLGDMLTGWFVFVVPVSIWGSTIFGEWALDFAAAFVLGIVFQYFTIAPMRNLRLLEGLVAALKADTLSLTAWQLGMYGWMAMVVFVIFRRPLPKTDPVYWFMMQMAMLVGFATAYPVNWWLLRRRIKEAM